MLTNRKRLVLTTAAVAMATALSSVLAAAPASAGRDTEVYSDDPGSPKGGLAWFKAEGEHFAVCDRSSDGLGVRGKLTWYTATGREDRKVWHHKGHHEWPNMNCTEYDKPLNIKEGTTIYLQVCLQEKKGAKLQYCDTDTGVA